MEDVEQPDTHVKTTPEWIAIVSDGVKIEEPTGWGTEGTEEFKYAWNEELITLDEFYRRRSDSVTDFTNYRSKR